MQACDVTFSRHSQPPRALSLYYIKLAAFLRPLLRRQLESYEAVNSMRASSQLVGMLLFNPKLVIHW